MKKNKLKIKDNKRLANISLRVLCLLTLVIFSLFFLVGYDMPSLTKEGMVEPLLTNTVLVFTYIVLFLSIAIAVWSLIKEFLLGAQLPSVQNGIKVKLIRNSTFISVPTLLILFFLLGSSSPLKVNGITFNNAFWLKASDMFIFVSILLLLIGIVYATWGTIKSYRRA
ncbi:hypothetical protein [Hoylesella nanceiensis]|jgi:hypothetical protein|uniref:hypothetical protein n=1 Tax=Hoylesella nanceiensis TaxID=425941 RepID=UPI0028E5C0D7|nr:hypothetical protein [Hoylesella nanceiensis]